MFKEKSRAIALFMSIMLICQPLLAAGSSSPPSNPQQALEPTNVTIISRTEASITLKWTPSTDSPKAAGYAI